MEVGQQRYRCPSYRCSMVKRAAKPQVIALLKHRNVGHEQRVRHGFSGSRIPHEASRNAGIPKPRSPGLRKLHPGLYLSKT